MRLVILVVMLSASACVFFDKDDHNPPPGCLAEAVPAINLIDPTTLECHTFTTQSCDPQCGPCPALAQPAPPSWGSCQSSCRAITNEVSCGLTAGCRVARDLAKHNAGLTDFIGCYPIDMNPAPSVPCGGLDAWNCSRHDDCEAFYTTNTTTQPVSELFQSCVPELQPL